jgi:hypothetical protein
MKPTLKPGIVLVILASVLSSCYSHKDITKKEPITQDFLSTLEPGKRYVFELKIGQIQTIYITSVDGQRVTGYLYPNGYNKKDKIVYDERFENIVKYVAKISERKINPAKTTVAILVPAAVIIPMVIVILEGGLVSMTF